MNEAATANLPLAPFEQHAAIVGRTGSGKSFAARGIVERWLEAGERVCVIDPTDVWWGLRANSAGDGAGFPVAVFGGEHADVLIGAGSGERVAGIIATRNLPAVVATAEMTTGERHRFMTDFLGTLYRRNRLPLHLVLDEADDLAPQNPLPENRRLLGDVDRIVRRGRVRGFRVVLITQRPAVLHKNVLSQASTLVAMRLPAPQDRKAIEDWVKGQADLGRAAEMLGSLSRLDRGEGWVWAPEQDVLRRTAFPPIGTYDSMRTPEHGAAVGEPTVLAPVELGDLRALLDATENASAFPPSNEGEKTNTGGGREELSRLRQENAQLHDELLAARGEIEKWRGYVLEIMGALERFRRVDDVAAMLDADAEELPVAARLRAPQPRLPEPPVAPGGDGALPVSAQKMLAVLARGLRLSWAQTATLAGLKARGGSFNTGRKALRDGGYIVEEGGFVAASEAGFAAAGGQQAAPATPDELVGWWRSVLPQTSGRVLDQLFRQGPRWIRKDRLAEFLGVAPRGGSWNTALSILRQNELIETKGDQLRASAALWSRE